MKYLKKTWIIGSDKYITKSKCGGMFGNHRARKRQIRSKGIIFKKAFLISSCLSVQILPKGIGI